jgi:hypothetical protein
MARTTILSKAILVLMCVLVLGPVALAQLTNATITGIVTDSSGAAIAGAHVRVHNLNTNASQTAESNGVGIYSVGQLLPGSYSVNTDRDGFRSSVQTGIILTVGQVATLNISLQVGDVKETVTVSGSAELINTTTAEISQVVNEHAISELPLNGRDPSSLVLLTTGMTNVLNTPASATQQGADMPNSTAASSGGGRQGGTYYLLDGAPNMDTYAMLAAPFPNADATQEFRVISNNFDARYGFSPNAVVSIQTKSGANAFHGGAFEFIRNNNLNASNYFSHNIDMLKRNQFGGYVGGPIRKDKVFFFVNYQATRESTAAGSNLIAAPTQAMLNGDFSAVPFALTGGFATVGGLANQIDPSLFDPQVVRLTTTALPLGQDPSTGNVNYIGSVDKQSFDEGTARIDWTINDSQHLFLRSFTQYYLQPGTSVKGNLLAVIPSYPGEYYNEALGHNWMINASTVNSATLFWTGMYVGSSGVSLDSNGNSVCLSKYEQVNEPAGECYLEGLTVGNAFSSNWNDLMNERRTNYGLSDVFTKTAGNHIITAGGNIGNQFAQENTSFPINPIVSFSNSYTGFDLADFLLGKMTNFEQGAGELSSVRGWQLGLFAQDQYRVKPHLTLTFGMRWDPNLPPTSAGGRGSAFHPNQQSTVYPNAPAGMVFLGDKGVNSAFMPTTYNYFQPRVGFSWQPAFLPRTAVRGGFGMFTGPLAYRAYNPLADIAPFSPTFTLNANPQANSYISFDNPWSYAPFNGVSPFPPYASTAYKPPTNSPIQTPVSLSAVFDDNFHLPTTQSWSLSIEQQLSQNIALHVAYVGSESYHQSSQIDQNPGIYAANGVRATYTSFGEINMVKSLGTSPYESLQAGLEKRISHGLQVQSSFTWSKVIDLSSLGATVDSPDIPDPFDMRHNRGISGLNVPFISISNFIYTSPSLQGWNVFAKNVLGNWQLSSIYTLQSGMPFGIVGGENGSNNSGSLQGGDRADVVPGMHACVKCGGKQNWLNHYVSGGAFQPNAPGTFGNSARNLFKSPYINTGDLSIAKNWRWQDRYGFEFRWEMFNAFNHTSYGAPDNSPTDSNFGQIVSTGPIPPRLMQGGLKFGF